MWIERTPIEGETVRFEIDGKKEIGVYLKRGYGSAQNFWIIDIGSRRVWVWDSATLEIYDK